MVITRKKILVALAAVAGLLVVWLAWTVWAAPSNMEEQLQDQGYWMYDSSPAQSSITPWPVTAQKWINDDSWVELSDARPLATAEGDMHLESFQVAALFCLTKPTAGNVAIADLLADARSLNAVARTQPTTEVTLPSGGQIDGYEGPHVICMSVL